MVKKTSFHEYDNGRRDGLIALNLRDGDELVRVIETSGSDDIFMVSRKGMTIRFNEDEVRPMGRAASGVRGMKLKPGDEVVVGRRCPRRHGDPDDHRAGYGKRTQLDKFNVQGRGGQGVIGIRLTGKKGQVVAAFMVGLDDEIVAVSSRRRHDPHGRPRHLLAGPRRHRRAGDEPRRRPVGRLGGADPRQRRGVVRAPASDRTQQWIRIRLSSARQRSGRRPAAGGGRDGRAQCRRQSVCSAQRIVDRGRAQTAADAAALAATDGGRAAAQRLAASNGAVLVSYAEAGDVVTVVVEVDGERAMARATDGP